MKKIAFVFMAMVAMTFASCGSSCTNGEASANDSDSVVVDSTVVDSVLAVDSAVVDSVVAE